MKITTRSFGWLFCVYAVHGFFYLLAVNDRLATPQSANADSSPKRGAKRAVRRSKIFAAERCPF